MSAFDVQTEIVRPPNSRRPRQAEVRKLTKLSASEERNATHPGGRVSRYCCFRPLAMNNTRKRRNAGSLLVSGSPKPRGHATASRAAHANRRANASRAAGRRNSPQGRRALAVADTIDVMDNMEDEGVEEVVDLTSEAVEAAMHVVDLTNNDSVLLVDEGARGRRSNLRESYVVSSDDDDAVSSSVPSANVLTSLQTQSSTRLTPGTISCPVCLDTYPEMVESGRLVVSTKCGHVFCSQCLRDALQRSHSCPTCRKRLTPRQYHPLYI
ncbi:E3 ubiquitin-protein ligase RNF4 isoform X2 [Vanacampus margaritifer]